MKGLIPKLLTVADKNSPIILTVVAVAGVAVTAYLAAKAVPKATAAIEDEEAKREGIITNSVSLNLLNCDSHVLVSLINETNSYDELIDKIKKTLANINISEDDLERKKRVLISNELFSFENIETINDIIVDNIIFDNRIEDNMINILRSLNKEELDNIVKKLVLDNKSIVILKNK